jgi:opacity protein-like surface antigen
MKKIKITFAAVCSLLLITISAKAQDGKLKLHLNYNYSIPVSDFNTDLVSNTSSRGFNGSLMYTFNNKWEGGLSVGYQDYYQKYGRTVYALSKTQHVSAILTNSIQITSVLLTARFSPLVAASVIPYISAGAGVNIIDFKQYLGEFGSEQTNTGFLAQGGLGVTVPFGKLKTSGIDVGANYNYSPYKKLGYNDLNTVSAHAGVFFQIK